MSLCLIYVCSSALMLKFDIRGCRNMFDLYVSFKMNKKVGAQKKNKEILTMFGHHVTVKSKET